MKGQEGNLKAYNIVKNHDSSQQFAVTYNNSTITNKINQQALEVNLYHYKQNSGFSIESTHSPEAIKTYFVLNGRCRHLEAECELTAGDLLVVGELDEFLNLYMLEDTTILVHGLNTEAYKIKGNNALKVSEILSKIQEKDSYTETHCSRVFMLVYQMALRLGYKGNRFFNIIRAARYHDVGKIFIQDEILTKPAQLTIEEYDVMKRHVDYGRELMADVFKDEIFVIMSQHHERVDGSGYPLGLKGDEICEEGRVLAICDSFDAMVTDRVYKKGKEIDESLIELKSLAGIHYDPVLLEHFEEVIRVLNVNKFEYNQLK